jgi:hypothetical protein
LERKTWEIRETQRSTNFLPTGEQNQANLAHSSDPWKLGDYSAI